MVKNIAVRGKREIVAVYERYAKISGQQDTGRPQATKEFVNYIARMPLNEETIAKLKLASTHRLDERQIEDVAIPASIKIPIEIEESTWEKAMNVFKYAFNLKSNPQMPYFIRVAGMAYLKNLEEQNLKFGIIETKSEDKNMGMKQKLEAFEKLSVEDKLCEIYRILLANGL